MKDIPSAQRRWFTAAEIAEVVAACGTEEIPTTESGVIRWIKRQAAAFPDSFGGSLSELSRPSGKRGGGKQYHLTLFDMVETPQVPTALQAAALRREDCVAAAEIDDLRELSPDDEALMLSMLAPDGWRSSGRFEPLKPRRVRRGMVEISTNRYWASELRRFEGQDVLVTSIYRHPHHVVFAWRSDGSRHRLACHGPKALIAMIEAPVEKSGVPPEAWAAIFGAPLGAHG